VPQPSKTSPMTRAATATSGDVVGATDDAASGGVVPTASTPVGAGAVAMGSRSATADPGIEHAVGEVHEGVDEHEQRREDHDRGLDYREVLGLDGLHQQAAHAGKVENGLDDDSAAEEAPEGDTGHGHQRERGRAQRVTPQDGAERKAFGPGGDDVLL